MILYDKKIFLDRTSFNGSINGNIIRVITIEWIFCFDSRKFIFGSNF
jgi:hypothetical protein